MTQSRLISELKQLALKDNLAFDNLENDNTIIICGAGISIESQLPSGWELIKKVLDTFDLGEKCYIDLVSWFEEYNKDVISKIKPYQIKLYNAPRLEVLFKCLKDVLPENEYHLAIKGFLFYNYKENKFNQSIFSNYQHYAIADFIINGGTVLTANFDNLIEHSITELNRNTEYNKIIFPLLQQTIVKKK